MSIVAKRLMDQDGTWHGGRPRPIVLDVSQPPSPEKNEKRGHSLPQFSAHVCCGQTVAHLATAEHFLWSPYIIGQTIIYLSCGFYLFFLAYNLIGRRLAVYHTSTHGVALVRI